MRPRIVVCAAIKYNDVMVCGPRHFDTVMRNQIEMLVSLDGTPTVVPWKQGFVDQFGVFMDRKEAFTVVMKNTQTFDRQRNGGPGDELFSEGIY